MTSQRRVMKHTEGFLTLLRFWMPLWMLASRNSRISSCSCQNMPALDSFSPLSPLEKIPTMTSRIRAYQLEILLRGIWTSKNGEVMVKPTHRGLFIRALRIPMFATLAISMSSHKLVEKRLFHLHRKRPRRTRASTTFHPATL
jgi:hypothetical protein